MSAISAYEKPSTSKSRMGMRNRSGSSSSALLMSASSSLAKSASSGSAETGLQLVRLGAPATIPSSPSSSSTRVGPFADFRYWSMKVFVMILKSHGLHSLQGSNEPTDLTALR